MLDEQKYHVNVQTGACVSRSSRQQVARNIAAWLHRFPSTLTPEPATHLQQPYLGVCLAMLLNLLHDIAQEGALR